MTETRYLRKTWLALVVAMVALLLLVPCVCLAEGGKEQDEIDRVIIEKDLQWQTRDYGGQQFALGDIEDDGKPHLAVPERSSGSLSLMDMDLPTALDWRDNGGNYVSPVKNQGQCGSCWAFAVVGAMEARYAISATTPGSFLDLAEQHMVSCDSNNLGCSGGNSYRAAQFAQTSGVPDEACFPYVASEPPCEDGCDDWAARAVHVSEFEAVSRSVDALKEALQQGPFQVSFNVYGDFYSYGEGVYEYATGTYRGGHAVVLVGYQDTPGETGGGHFIVKNSWATGWGEDGYFRIGYSQVTNSINFGRSAYQYYMDMPEPDSYEPDDDAGAASQIVEGSAQQHSIVERGDIDWVYFDVVDDPKYVTIWTNGVEGGDTVLTLYDSSQQVLDTDDDGGQGYYSQIRAWLAPGRYYASVRAYRSDVIISAYAIDMRTATGKEAADVDGDALLDAMVWQPSSGEFRVARSTMGRGSTSGMTRAWGKYGDVPLTGDVDGDGLADMTAFRPSTGKWYSLLSRSGYSFQDYQAWDWGKSGDVPLFAELDGDGASDSIVFRPSNGTWYMLFSADNYSYGTYRKIAWGKRYDVPAVGDLDGDLIDDLVVFRPSNGTWYMLFSADDYSYSTYRKIAWGKNGDVPLLAEVDGDGRADLIVWRPSNGTWYMLFSADDYSYGTYRKIAWGKNGDNPLTGDVDGDGIDDLIVRRPSNGRWYALQSTGDFSFGTATSWTWGASSDLLVASY